MESNTGWISVYRSILNHWLLAKGKSRTEFEAWIIILLEVNHTKQKVRVGNQIFTCNRGESLNSLDTWARKFNWHKSKVRRFLKLLESDSMIELKSERKTTHLKVCRYEYYQDLRNVDESQMKHKRNADETQTTLNNNDNNVNNENNIYKEPLKKFKKPSISEIRNYCIERNNNVDPEVFFDYYESNGWKVGKVPMKDWKAAIRVWEKNNKSLNHGSTNNRHPRTINETGYAYTSWD